MVLVELGVCLATYTDTQIAIPAAVPLLIVFGDHLDTPTGIPGFSRQTAFDGCRAFVTRVNAASGNARMLLPQPRAHTPAAPLHGSRYHPPYIEDAGELSCQCDLCDLLPRRAVIRVAHRYKAYVAGL